MAINTRLYREMFRMAFPFLSDRLMNDLWKVSSKISVRSKIPDESRRQIGMERITRIGRQAFFTKSKSQVTAMKESLRSRS